MEDKGFLDYNPQLAHNNNYVGNFYSDEDEGNVFTRFFMPGNAENIQFDRENYFVDKENAFNEYMYNKANEYNSASAQMERAKEAGINPNLMAAGISGMGGNQAAPIQGARGDIGMNTNAASPIEQIGSAIQAATTGIQGANELGEILGYGQKNRAEINQIKENAIKAAEEAKFTRRQRIQLQAIGQTLVDNAKLEGKQIEANIENLNKLNEVYQQQKYNIAADTNLKEAQTGTEYENQKTIWYDNMRKEYEKTFRDMFGAELTHDKLQFLVEACMNGHGETIVKYFTDTMAGVIKGLKKTATELFKIPRLRKIETPTHVTSTDRLGNETNFTFETKRQRTKWQNQHLKQAKEEWEKKGKKKGQDFETYLKIYCNKRGLKMEDLLEE